MNTTSDNEKLVNKGSWDGLINEAMDEISTENVSVKSTYQLPVNVFYLVIAALVFSMFYHWPGFSDTHDGPSVKAIQSGQRIGLLTMADDIVAFQRRNGELPEELPSLLSNIIQVKYTRLSNNYFELRMPIIGGELVLSHKGNDEHLYTEPEQS